MAPRRRDFRLASRNDDESYPMEHTARRSDAEARRKARRPRLDLSGGGREKARLRRCRASTYLLVDTLRPSALHPGLFPAIAGPLASHTRSHSLLAKFPRYNACMSLARLLR